MTYNEREKKERNMCKIVWQIERRVREREIENIHRTEKLTEKEMQMLFGWSVAKMQRTMMRVVL